MANSITLSDDTIINYSLIAITGSVPVQATRIIYSDGKEAYGVGILDPLVAYASAALPAAPLVVAPIVTSSIQTIAKIAKLNLTDSTHSAIETGWQNLVVGNAEKTYAIANNWSVHFLPTTGISIGALKVAVNDVDFPNDVLASQLYLNAAGVAKLEFDFLGLDPAKHTPSHLAVIRQIINQRP